MIRRPGLLYRPEIDGLRAVAVLSVLLYHAAALIPGGFVGVDVFFVISGYVITRTIATDLDAGRFSLWSFYERRVRRIAPALIVVILATAAASAVILLPVDLDGMGRSAIAAALMVSNMLFWGQAGYFDAAAQAKPLLHTWSLGIEEQFYLVYPLVVAALWRHARRALVPALCVLAALSFAAAAWHISVDPSDVFYLAPFRFWELLVGGLIALRPVRALEGSAFAGLGLALIVAALVLYDGATTFPGPAALLPTLGAALAINGAREGMAAARLLAVRPLVFVGKISYSLYLVHWPLIVLVEYRQDARLDGLQAAAVIAASFALAWASWRFVEQPFRAKGHGGPSAPRPKVFAAAGLATAACCALGAVFVASNGLPDRLSPEVRAVYAMIQPDRSHDYCFVDTRGRTGPSLEDIRAGKLCSLGQPPEEGRPRFLVWGDSHAAALAPGVFKAGDEAGLKGMFVGAGSCPPLQDFTTLTARDDTNRRCHEVNEAVFDLLEREKIPLVFMIARWTRAANGNGYGDEGMFFDPDRIAPPVPGEDARFAAALDATLARLKAIGVRPVVVQSVPEAGYIVPYALAKAMMAGREVDLAPSAKSEFRRDGRATEIIQQAAERHGAEVVEPDPFFCGAEKCDVVRDGVPLYRDADHVTPATALALAPLYSAVMQREVAQGAARGGEGAGRP